MSDELINAMSNEDLKALKTKYPKNQSIVTLIDGILGARANQEAEAKAKAKFTNGIAKLFDKLPHPSDVHNVYIRWSEVEVEDTSEDPEEVDIVLEPAINNGEGKITTPAVMGKEMRLPLTKVFKWVVEVNKGFEPKAANGNATASKRAITLYRHNTEGADELVGNYQSASKACSHLKITIGGDSATRVLTREGYYIIPYTGQDFTS